MRRGIADSASDRLAVFDEADRNAELGNALDELARAVERIDDPDVLLVEARRIVDALFGEPAFAVAQQILAQHGVDGAVGFGDGIVSGLVFGFDFAGSEAGEDVRGQRPARPECAAECRRRQRKTCFLKS